MERQYVWTNGCRLVGSVDPLAVGVELDTIQASNGQRLTPRVVVDAARPDESVLHPCFEWDDLRAAEMFREDQARYVLRSIRVVQNDDAGKPTTVHAFVNLTETVGDEEQQSYIPIVLVLRDSALRRQLIEQALRDLQSCERKYAQFTELVEVFSGARLQIAELAATE